MFPLTIVGVVLIDDRDIILFFPKYMVLTTHSYLGVPKLISSPCSNHNGIKRLANYNLLRFLTHVLYNFFNFSEISGFRVKKSYKGDVV